MVVYNVTINVDNDVREAWLRWMRETHIPEVLDTGLFRRATLTRVLAEEEGGSTYAVQYLCHDMESFDHYERNFAAELRTRTEKQFGGKFVAFRTLLQVIDEFDGSR